MEITLDQARALDALARRGTLKKAAEELHKGHTAVLYALDRLEEQTGLSLLDRAGYRTRLTGAGERVLEHCRRLLQEEQTLKTVVEEIKTGYEPWVHIVLDGILPIAPVLSVVKSLRAEGVPTRLKVSVATLSDVETTFLREGADLMASLLPAEAQNLRGVRLPPLSAHLVVHCDHPLARMRGPLPLEALDAHVLVTVRGSDPRLELSTSPLDQRATVHLADFAAKKTAILQGIGFGWLPDHLLEPERKTGLLRDVPLTKGAIHKFQPRLYHREGVKLGHAGTRLLEAMTATAAR